MPPKPYTQGELVKAMKGVARFVTDPRLKQKLKDTTGIGTEATRANIISGLIARGYIVKKGRSIRASDAAFTLIDAVPAAMAADLDANWEVLGEPVQSAMRALGAQGVPGMEEPYERLKELTRGQRIGQPELVEFVRGLGLPADVEERVAAMTHATYTGIAPQLVDLLD